MYPKYYFLDFLYTSTNQNKPKLRRRRPRPPKKVPTELIVLATSTVNLAANHVAIQHQKFSPLDRLNLRK